MIRGPVKSTYLIKLIQANDYGEYLIKLILVNNYGEIAATLKFPGHINQEKSFREQYFNFFGDNLAE